MDTVLSSAQNPLIKQLRKLAKSGKERRESNLYLAEGIHLTESFLTSGRIPQMYLLAESAVNNHEVAELLEELEKTSAKKVIVTDSVFETISNTHADSGICLTFALPKNTPSTCIPLVKTSVLLEDVQDPGNLGTILRSAAATGVSQILLSAGCASPWSPKALRAGMGAQFSLHIYEDIDLINAVQTAKIQSIATTLTGASRSIYETDLHGDVAWVFGSEGPGLSEDLSEVSTAKITIPQEGNTVESLNVAAAATVCLFEQYRQNLR